MDTQSNVYVADTDNNEIRKITPAGVVSTLAGYAPTVVTEQLYYDGEPFPNTDGTGGGASFFFPYGVAVDSAGNVYVADSYNSEIRKITPGGVVTTLGGQPSFADISPLEAAPAFNNGAGSVARFFDPVGIAVDGQGNLYVGDTDNCVIRKGTAPQVQVVALEVTQVVQDWKNSVTLVQGKDTYLRAHLQLASLLDPDVNVAGALLYGTANGQPLPNSPTTPINPGASLKVTTYNASNTVIRRDLTKSLNFRLPPEWLNGTINLQLVWAGGLQPTNVVSNNCSVNVTFSPASVPQIEFWDVQWNGTNQMGDAIHDMRNRVLSCLPVSNLNVTYGILPLAGTQTPDFGKGEEFVSMVNSKLYDQRKRDYAHNLITKRIYHGVIAAYTGLGENTISPNIAGKAMLPFPSFVSCATVVNTWGAGRQSVTHELGHNLGLDHDVDRTIFGTTTIAAALGGRSKWRRALAPKKARWTIRIHSFKTSMVIIRHEDRLWGRCSSRTVPATIRSFMAWTLTRWRPAMVNRTLPAGVDPWGRQLLLRSDELLPQRRAGGFVAFLGDLRRAFERGQLYFWTAKFRNGRK